MFLLALLPFSFEHVSISQYLWHILVFMYTFGFSHQRKAYHVYTRVQFISLEYVLKMHPFS